MITPFSGFKLILQWTYRVYVQYMGDGSRKGVDMYELEERLICQMLFPGITQKNP